MVFSILLEDKSNKENSKFFNNLKSITFHGEYVADFPLISMHDFDENLLDKYSSVSIVKADNTKNGYSFSKWSVKKITQHL